MIHLQKGDITKLEVDAIVNAANSTLLGGGGVDGAIHRAAGPMLLAECKTLYGCHTGEAKITKGYELKAKHVIHTVGPIWTHRADVYEKDPTEANSLLASCYYNSLKLAEDRKLTSIAFPCISTGVYGFPQKAAAEVALKEIKKFLKESSFVKEVTICCFLDSDLEIYHDLLKANLWQKILSFVGK